MEQYSIDRCAEIAQDWNNGTYPFILVTSCRIDPYCRYHFITYATDNLGHYYSECDLCNVYVEWYDGDNTPIQWFSHFHNITVLGSLPHRDVN